MNRQIFFYIFIFLLVSICFSCTKEPSVVDYDTGHYPIKYDVDTTIYLDAYTVLQDTINTYNKPFGLIGGFNDPVFGVSTAGLFTQMWPKELKGLGDDAVMDSLVMVFAVSGGFGDANSIQQLALYQLTDTIGKKIHYTTVGDTVVYDYNKPLFKAMYRLSKDSVMVNGKKEAPQIRINLTEVAPEFAEYLFNVPSENMNSAENFLKYLHGFYFAATSGGSSLSSTNSGGFLQLDLINEVTGMYLFYHNSSNNGLVARYTINKEAKRWLYYRHYGFASADPFFKQQVLAHDTVLGRDRLYVQSMLGVKVKVLIPDLEPLRQIVERKGKIVINEAKLFVNNIGGDYTISPPEALVLRGRNIKGALVALSDEINEGASFYSGIYDKNKKQYYLRISRFVSELLYGFNNVYAVKYLELYSYNDVTSEKVKPAPERLILGGSDPQFTDKDKRLKLQILYSFSNETKE